MLQQNESDVLGDDLGVLRFDHALWDYPQRWPHNPPGHVFLARAFNKIGRSEYGEQWRELDWDDAAAEDNWEDDWEDRHEPAFEDEEQWDAYERALEQGRLIFRQERAQILQKRAVIARMISRQCELGVLVAAIRPVQGGPIKSLEAHYWNTELIASRFYRCAMSLAQPFARAGKTLTGPFAANHGSRDHYWIYITLESLERCLSGKEKLGTKPALQTEAAGTGPAGIETSSPRHGRTPGSGSFHSADEPLVNEMHDLITSGKAQSRHDAARQLANKAVGPGTEESKRTRLRKAYRKKFRAHSGNIDS